jgi:hypothetical protein
LNWGDNSILLMLPFTNLERNNNSSSSLILRLSILIKNVVSMKASLCLFPGKYSNVVPFFSRSKIHRKTQSEALYLFEDFYVL